MYWGIFFFFFALYIFAVMVSARADGDRGDPFAIFKAPVKRTKTMVPDSVSRVKRFFSGKSHHFNFIYAHCELVEQHIDRVET